MRKHLLPFGFIVLFASMAYALWAVTSDFAENQKAKEWARSFNEKSVTFSNDEKNVTKAVNTQDIEACMNELKTSDFSVKVIECIQSRTAR